MSGWRPDLDDAPDGPTIGQDAAAPKGGRRPARSMPAASEVAQRALPRLALRVADAALALGVSTRTVKRLLASRELRARRLGRSVLIEWRELERFLSAQPEWEGGGDG
ncbi:MAG: helix-turn-helix domain-containing protein [Phycisphaeraceae bacterium]|nr:helix-turn-helix domain-containing protein [Phycisphaeraceae bacterium]